MSERVCVAKIEDVLIGPHTEMTVECGLTNREHLHQHLARHRIEGFKSRPAITVTITWQGDFTPAEGEESGDE